MRFHRDRVLYWQDKSRREIDFVIRRADGTVDAVECRINPDGLDAASLQAFRRIYPDGTNYVVTPLDREPYAIRRGGLPVTVCATRHLG